MPKPRLHRSSRLLAAARPILPVVPPVKNEPQNKRPRPAELLEGDEDYESESLLDLSWPDDRGSVVVGLPLIQTRSS